METAAAISEYMFGDKYAIKLPEPQNSDLITAFEQLGFWDQLRTSRNELINQSAVTLAMKQI